MIKKAPAATLPDQHYFRRNQSVGTTQCSHRLGSSRSLLGGASNFSEGGKVSLKVLRENAEEGHEVIVVQGAENDCRFLNRISRAQYRDKLAGLGRLVSLSYCPSKE